MESILARALEYTLKYWLKSFTRDQFKLQGRTVQLSNLDINGDALHASVGLPPALNVTSAKVGKLEIKLPSVSNVNYEPIVVEIDRLDLVLEENSDIDAAKSTTSTQSSTSSAKGGGYGFADKLADGMTLGVGIVNLMIGTRGGAGTEEGATWASPLASITIRNLLLYTTNENWQVVNLKQARDFSNSKKCIYVFKKLEWESLSVDLLPHPDMFTDVCSNGEANSRDGDGAKRVFFGGERFLEGISGQANITVQRTEQNSPLGLEVQLHVTEAVCPALSEPGLRALLRFMTGFYVCLNKEDVDPKAQQRCTEAAGRSIVSVVVDHIFLCIKDSEFQLELLMQSLAFSRASVCDGEKTKNLSRITVSGFFLRDTFSHPPCTLVQPSMQAVMEDSSGVPDFGENFCPPIYPLQDQQSRNECIPLICLHSLQEKPSPAPPSFASETVINCQPLMINLQEESCLRIASFLADGIVVNPGDVLPDTSVNSLVFSLEGLDITVPIDPEETDKFADSGDDALQNRFAGARLHIEDLLFSQSPSLKLRLLNLDKDPSCFCLWEDQPVDASQKKWSTHAKHLSLALEMCNALRDQGIPDWSTGLWRCVELHEICIQAAMATADGSPIRSIPPPGGIARFGVSCQQYLSNASVEQLFFVLDLYAYFGRVSEKIAEVGKNSKQKASKREFLGKKLMERVPSDTAASVAINDLQLRFLEHSSLNFEGMPLVQFSAQELFIKVSHRTLGGAFAISSNVRWESVQVDCVDTDGNLALDNGLVETPSIHAPLITGNGHPQMRAVFWIDGGMPHPNGVTQTVPFLEISVIQVMPFDARDMECHSISVSAKVAGVRLGGGMNYTEALLHRFGILGLDGGPGEGLSKGLKNLSAGPLSKLLRTSPLIEDELKEDGSSEDERGDRFLDLGKPEDVDVSIELKNWLFALEGAQEMAERWWFHGEDVNREEMCWHTMFQSLQVKAKSSPKHVPNGTAKALKKQKYPVELVTVGVEGLQALKPQTRNDTFQADVSLGGIKSTIENSGGVNLEVRLMVAEDNECVEPNWVVENLKFSVKQPIEATATKEELQHLAILCKSEADSMGRIAAGVLRVLKLDASVGQAALEQLSNLGSDSLEKIFSPDKLSRHCSFSTVGLTPTSRMISESPRQNLESTVASLESAISDSQAKCSTLIAEFSNPDMSVQTQHLSDINHLSQKLENMQSLLTRLQAQI